MADKALQREALTAGLPVGQAAGQATIDAANSRAAAASAAGQVPPAPEEIRKTISDAAARHGVDPAGLLQVAGLESGYNPQAKNPNSSAGGLFQFVDGTAQQYGLADRFDATQASDAAARLYKDNTAALRKSLGREPTAGELYLAHQQGAGGAAKLLTNPDVPAESLVGADAVRLNGGTPGMTAGEFANLWIRKAGGSAAGALPAADRPPQVLPTAPLALRRDGTIYGEAYDNAVMSAYTWRMQQGVSTDLFAIQQQYSDDPEKFAAALADVRAKYEADPNLSDPLLKEAFNRSFSQQSEAYVRNVQAQADKRMRQEQLSAFADGFDAQRVDIERQAQLLGANPEGDTIIGQQVGRVTMQIDRAAALGTITPLQAAKYKADLAETAAFGRVQGVYEALPTPEQKEQFALQMLDEWRAGKGPLARLPYDTVKARSELFRRDARAEINQRQAANKAEASRLATLADDDVASIQTTGKGLDPSTGLTPERVLQLSGEQGLQQWQAARERAGRIYDATNGMEAQSAADIRDRLELIQPKAGTPGYAEALDVYQLAQKRAQDVLKERQTDPLGQAARAGVVSVTAIDPSSADTLAATLTERRQAQTAVAGLYGQSVPVFRPGEKEMLTAALQTNPEALPVFAFTVRKVYGNDAPRVIGEIAEDAPVIAHAAGLSLATGDNSVAADVANALGMKREKLFTAKMPTPGEITKFASTQIGGAFVADPRTQSAVLQTATILFEQAANAQNFDPAEIKTSGSIAQAAFSRALDRAAGGRTIGGVAYGGISDVNGAPIVVPADMPKDRPQQLLRNLTKDQLAKLPPIDSGDYPLPISAIRGANLVSDGDGLYRVSLGDPLSEDPKYLVRPDGTYWRLDIRALEAIAAENKPSLGFSDTNFNPFGWQPGR
ncbi:hypothetical protein FNA46_07785 [Rhizobium straminoryzae]|uniref:Transglycosylase SLT domain-containing protein n=2 Tax=Rhizobium straminoryzae TaxID=1387186 RepID=A0A549TD59_9HYPH|nr:hypothetical protein FNA46_07785 [Rhizobium straminoryzae]